MQVVAMFVTAIAALYVYEEPGTEKSAPIEASLTPTATTTTLITATTTTTHLPTDNVRNTSLT